MADETTQQTGAGTTPAAGELREVPQDIRAYEKFKAEGGHEHNEKILGREAAVAAAKAAGIVPDSETGEAQEKNNNGFQRRVARLQRKIGERDARIADLEKRLGAAPASNGAAPAANGAAAPTGAPAKAEEKPVHAGADKTPPKPVEKDFKTYAEFVEALTDWKTDRKIEERERRSEEAKRASDTETRGKAIREAHDKRVDEAKKRYSDWEGEEGAFAGLTDESFTDPMVVFIIESEHGPDVTYYLVTHRDELERIHGLSPLKQVAALGRIEALFESDDNEGEKPDDEGEGEKEKPPAAPAKKPDTPEPKPQPKRVSTAPPPPAKPLGGKAGADDPMPDPKDFKAYEAWSKRQAARGVKR